MSGSGTPSEEPAAPVVLSFALCGSSQIVNSVLRAAVAHTYAPMLIHVSRDSGFWWHTERWLRASQLNRAYLNPERLRGVRLRQRGDSGLLAQLSNVAFCARPGMPCHGTPAGQLLLTLGCDTYFFRPGVERWAVDEARAAGRASSASASRRCGSQTLSSRPASESSSCAPTCARRRACWRAAARRATRACRERCAAPPLSRRTRRMRYRAVCVIDTMVHAMTMRQSKVGVRTEPEANSNT